MKKSAAPAKVNTELEVKKASTKRYLSTYLSKQVSKRTLIVSGTRSLVGFLNYVTADKL